MYVSIALVVLSLIYLGIVAVKTSKETKVSLNDFSATAARLQEKVDKINEETTNLTNTSNQITENIQSKKETIQGVIGEAKATPEPFKKLFTSIKNTPNPQKDTSDERLVELGDRLIDMWGRYRVKRKSRAE
ncbi:DUF948 domain-containing protein [Alkalihalobacillus sp. CinArs1]|uniref:DUF948 domain-containing protein n=1 Tax=Alkalihalobacillus sp. CinArs1 TaxID=2995314 RepID=UPI0022DE428C|nr:DUF948 domain-containing protein [Alkalihalobacillus sp. CinArs1]